MRLFFLLILFPERQSLDGKYRVNRSRSRPYLRTNSKKRWDPLSGIHTVLRFQNSISMSFHFAPPWLEADTPRQVKPARS